MQKIVSFLPSATELIYALDAQDMLLGVTHECVYPKEAKSKPKVIDTIVDSEKLNSKQIDEVICKLINDGKDIFVLNKENIRKANPNLIISQNTCEVCAAHTNQVQQVIEMLETKPEIYSMDPHNIKEILTGVIEFSKIINVEEKGKNLKKELEKRIEKIKNKKINNTPKIVAIEWVDPFFTAGHWVPEMIEISGGVNLISKTGEHSRKMTMQEIENAQPEIIILMPCGFDVKRTKIEYEKFLKNDKDWNKLQAVKENKVFAVDANSFFSKPSIRTIDGIEILAKIIHPEIFSNISIPENSYVKLGSNY
ncbi:MAG: cobalamin-binding protein [Thaumarchaeota archaeon]|nr:MAG: cobalamin-binding protein [Nitrososphaerota archaeon]